MNVIRNTPSLMLICWLGLMNTQCGANHPSSRPAAPTASGQVAAPADLGSFANSTAIYGMRTAPWRGDGNDHGVYPNEIQVLVGPGTTCERFNAAQVVAPVPEVSLEFSLNFPVDPNNAPQASLPHATAGTYPSWDLYPLGDGNYSRPPQLTAGEPGWTQVAASPFASSALNPTAYANPLASLGIPPMFVSYRAVAGNGVLTQVDLSDTGTLVGTFDETLSAQTSTRGTDGTYMTTLPTMNAGTLKGTFTATRCAALDAWLSQYH